jgi:hypothetical protein
MLFSVRQNALIQNGIFMYIPVPFLPSYPFPEATVLKGLDKSRRTIWPVGTYSIPSDRLDQPKKGDPFKCFP